MIWLCRHDGGVCWVMLERDIGDVVLEVRRQLRSLCVAESGRWSGFQYSNEYRMWMWKEG